MKKNDTRFEGLAKALVRWQKRFGRQGLPWMCKDPYRRWLSEVMLQQTQVSVVIDYFNRFLKAYPTLHDLAQADEESVMRLWAGLGYYSRARNLLRCAQTVEQQYGGRFPKDIDALCALPGIGRSTAGAIASFSFGQRTPILDGNVKRVFSRLLALTAPLGSATAENHLWTLAEQLVPEKDAGPYNQALMDIGATLCTRTHPRCDACPLCPWCKACHQGAQERFPVRKKHASKPTRTAIMLLIRKGDSVWLTKRTKPGVWRGLWSLPEAETHSGDSLLAFRHEFTHFRLEASVCGLVWERQDDPPGPGRWHLWEEALQQALPAPVKRVLLLFSASGV